MKGESRQGTPRTESEGFGACQCIGGEHALHWCRGTVLNG